MDVSVAKWGAFLQFLGALIGISGLIGQNTLSRIETRIRYLILNLINLEKVKRLLRLTQEKIKKSRKSVLLSGCLISFISYVILYYTLFLNHVDDAIQIFGFGTIIAFAVINILIREFIGPRLFFSTGKLEYIMYVYILLNLPFLIIIGGMISIFFVLWVLLRYLITFLLILFLFLLLILLLPYVFFDKLIFKFKLSSTLMAIGILLGIVGSFLQVIG